jgi:hypothetical protein
MQGEVKLTNIQEVELKTALRLIRLQARLLEGCERPTQPPTKPALERLLPLPEVLRRTGLSERLNHAVVSGLWT